VPETPEPHPESAPSDLAGALHEVSNALTVVVGWLERARAADGAPEEVAKALEIASSRAAEARSLVRAAIGAGEAPDLHRPIGGVVADAVIGLEPEIHRAGLRVLVDVGAAAADRPIAHAAKVLQILTNLLLNAIAFSPAGSTVRIEAHPSEQGGVVFTVADEGPGVPPERRATLLQGGASTRAGGAGIGLRHAAALARAHGGELALVDSPAGARFQLAWPIAAGVGGSTRPPASAPPRSATALAGSRILLLEDDDAVIDLIDTALTARGADVVSIRAHGELTGALASGPFDAALFDISPIAHDVLGAVSAMRASSRAPRLVLISGSAAQMPPLPSGWVAAWVRKPFEIGELLHALDGRDRGAG
jgi:CheY-like chemotaxis protein